MMSGVVCVCVCVRVYISDVHTSDVYKCNCRNS